MENAVIAEQTFLEGTASEKAMTEGAEAGDDSLDKLTAIEMLQLLKEYKKRELLYVFEITSLQKELYLSSQSKSHLYDSAVLTYHSSQTALLDPVVNLEIRELRLRLQEKETELQKAKDELRASTFSADSVMGRRLINKCKALQEENTDIGKMLLENQLQPLQLQIGLLQKQLAFFKKQLLILHELNAELDRDNQNLLKQLHEVTRLYRESQPEKERAKSTSGIVSSSKANETGDSYPRSSSPYRERSTSRHGTRRSSRKRSSERPADEHTAPTETGSHRQKRDGERYSRRSREPVADNRDSRRRDERRRRERSPDAKTLETDRTGGRRGRSGSRRARSGSRRRE